MWVMALQGALEQERKRAERRLRKRRPRRPCSASFRVPLPHLLPGFGYASAAAAARVRLDRTSHPPPLPWFYEPLLDGVHLLRLPGGGSGPGGGKQATHSVEARLCLCSTSYAQMEQESADSQGSEFARVRLSFSSVLGYARTLLSSYATIPQPSRCGSVGRIRSDRREADFMRASIVRLRRSQQHVYAAAGRRRPRTRQDPRLERMVRPVSPVRHHEASTAQTAGGIDKSARPHGRLGSTQVADRRCRPIRRQQVGRGGTLLGSAVLLQWDCPTKS